jgi:nicotinamide-nucleotide amidase
MMAEIIAVGSELLTPFRTDTNSLWLTEKLNEMGIDVKLKSVIGDELQVLAAFMKDAFRRSDIIIVTGGLGPTEDDLTREALSDALNRPLSVDENIVEGLRRRFEKYGFKMTENNLRQAMVLEGAVILENRRGSAPGQWLEVDDKIAVLLPGPPGEMSAMFEREVKHRLEERAAGLKMVRRTLKATGLTESALDDMIAPIYKPYTNPITTIISTVRGLEVHLTAVSGNQGEAEVLIEELAAKVKDRLGEYVFSDTGETLEKVVGDRLVARQMTIAVAESCTGGLIAKRLTDVAGSSRYLLSGVVAYSNEAKADLLGVPADLIQAYGAVSGEVVEAMASGIRAQANADIGVGVTGIAGPDGGTPEKPVGLVYLGLADRDGVQHRKFNLPGDRERVRELTAQLALDWVRRRVVG